MKYLRQILDVKEQQPELFQRILALPRKARSTRIVNQAGLPAVITYFRQGRLDKFFRADGNNADAEELDFFTTAEILETTAHEHLQKISPERFYPLLDKNKAGFQSATTPGVDAVLTAIATGSSNEASILKRLRARDFRNSDALKPEDRKLVAEIHQIIADGRVGKATIRKVKEAFDQTADPIEMVAILRKCIASQYLLGSTAKPDPNAPLDPREIILSSYLLEAN